MNENTATVMLIGYGNPGRFDDGLGPALAAAVEQWRVPGVTVDADYQLTLEDAAAAARHDVVIFADADASGCEPFTFRMVEPAPALGFSTHSIQPSAVLGLAHELFGARTRGYVLGIRGYAFDEFNESLSEGAQENLAAALRFIEPVLRERKFCDVAADPGGSAVKAVAPVNEVVSCKTANT